MRRVLPGEHTQPERSWSLDPHPVHPGLRRVFLHDGAVWTQGDGVLARWRRASGSWHVVERFDGAERVAIGTRLIAMLDRRDRLWLWNGERLVDHELKMPRRSPEIALGRDDRTLVVQAERHGALVYDLERPDAETRSVSSGDVALIAVGARHFALATHEEEWDGSLASPAGVSLFDVEGERITFIETVKVPSTLTFVDDAPKALREGAQFTVVDLADGAETLVFSTERSTSCSADGRRAVIADDESAILVDAMTGERGPRLEVEVGERVWAPIKTLPLPEEGAAIVVGRVGSFDRLEGQNQSTLRLRRVPEKAHAIEGVAAAPDGRALFAWGRPVSRGYNPLPPGSGHMHRWELDGESPTNRFEWTGKLRGPLVVVAHDRVWASVRSGVVCWLAGRGVVRLALKDLGGATAISPDGTTLAVASRDRARIQLWALPDVAALGRAFDTGKRAPSRPLTTLSVDRPPTALRLAFDSDGVLHHCAFGQIRSWDREGRERSREYPSSWGLVARSANGSRVAFDAGGETLRVEDLRTGELLLSRPGRPSVAAFGHERLAWVRPDGVIEVIDAQGTTERRLGGTWLRPEALAFTPEGTLSSGESFPPALVGGSRARRLWCWPLDTEGPRSTP